MKVTMTMSGVDAVQQAIGGSERRARAAVATALTRTAVSIKARQVEEMQRVLDRPTPYALRGLYVKPATAATLQAEVWIKDDRATSNAGTPAVNFLGPQVEGGARHVKRFEVALQASNAMPRGTFAVPGRGAKLDAFGNISKGQLTQILSQVAVEMVSGYNRRIVRVPKWGTDKDKRLAANKRRRALGRAGGQYVALPNGRGKLKPGIYLAEGRDFGARLGYGRNGRLVPVLLFVRRPNYKPRWDFFGVGQQVSDSMLPNELGRAVADAYQAVQAKRVERLA